ncbi:class I SAM-dependent methyltransferase [Marinactinospora rubrisoli]|uniref:Class I SAM-dependent methyltransferase n=1 Tax=Marinactinospora rubrisoli TaxID=2715399 RepID=A0ABW2KNG3_9ACTN
MSSPDRAARFWDEQYRSRTAESPVAKVNPRLAEIAGPLPPGAALDLGCGAGGDALWLAGRGWRVTAVDISAAAVHTLRRQAGRTGVPVTALRVDLAADFPAGTFDLVSAQYLHTPFALNRAQVLRTAATSVNPGGRLAVVDHGSTAPWSWNQDPDLRYPTPREVAAELALDPAEWSIERADTPQRQATGPAGRTATVVDHVLVIRRAGAAPEGRR